jgi:hypothetical protein
MSARSRVGAGTRGTRSLVLCRNAAPIRPFGGFWGVGYRLVDGPVEELEP